MIGHRFRGAPVDTASEALLTAARHQVEQLIPVRLRAQPTTVYIARLTGTAILAYLLALLLPGSSRPVLAPLTALLVVQATAFHTIRSAGQRVAAVTAGVLGAVGVTAYVPFSWWVLGLLIAAMLALGNVLRLREQILEVPISAMLIFSAGSHAEATSRITDTLVGTAAGLGIGLVFAPLRVQPAKEAVGELSRGMAELLGEMADGLTAAPRPVRPRDAAGWLDRTLALRGEIERLEDTLVQAEDSIRLNPWRLRLRDPAVDLREGVDRLERAATSMRVLARSVSDSARLDSEHSPVKEAGTRARLAAVLAQLSGAVRAHGQLIEADLGSVEPVEPNASPSELIAEVLEVHLEEARRQQHWLAMLLHADPAERPDGWPLRGEILAHVDRLRSELQPAQTGLASAQASLRAVHRRHRQSGGAPRSGPTELCGPRPADHPPAACCSSWPWLPWRCTGWPGSSAGHRLPAGPQSRVLATCHGRTPARRVGIAPGRGQARLIGPGRRRARRKEAEMYPRSIRALQAEALFASALQRSDQVNVSKVRQAVAMALDAYGDAGCAGRVAQEFGDHPETAAARMRWARDTVAALDGQGAPKTRRTAPAGSSPFATTNPTAKPSAIRAA